MSKKTRPIIKQLASTPFFITLYLLASIIPRSSTRLVFASWYGQKYGDSTRYLFEEARKRKTYEPFYIVKEKALLDPANPDILYAYSPRGIWAQLTARYFFCTVNSFDFFAPCIGRNAELVQICHGMPIKQGFEEKFNLFSRVKNMIRRISIDRYRYVVSAHEIFDEILQKQWRVYRDQIVVLPMPRCDALFEVKHRFHPDWLADTDKLLLYAPTHRDEGQTIDEILKNCHLLSNFFSKINMSESKFSPMVKLHYYDEHFAEYIEKETNLRVISPETETNHVLSRTDILIGDYSGIVYDYSYLNRPIICLATDYESYTTVHRSLYFKLEQLFHHVAYNSKDFHRLLTDVCSGKALELGLKIDLTPTGCAVGEFSSHSFDIIEKRIIRPERC